MKFYNCKLPQGFQYMQIDLHISLQDESSIITYIYIISLDKVPVEIQDLLYRKYEILTHYNPYSLLFQICLLIKSILYSLSRWKKKSPISIWSSFKHYLIFSMSPKFLPAYIQDLMKIAFYVS